MNKHMPAHPLISHYKQVNYMSLYSYVLPFHEAWEGCRKSSIHDGDNRLKCGLWTEAEHRARRLCGTVPQLLWNCSISCCYIKKNKIINNANLLLFTSGSILDSSAGFTWDSSCTWTHISSVGVGRVQNVLTHMPENGSRLSLSILILFHNVSHFAAG